MCFALFLYSWFRNAWALAVFLSWAVLPQRRVHNSKFRNFMGLPLTLWINPTNPFSGVGIAHHPDPVPHHHSLVEGVLNDAVAALPVAIDGRCVPNATAGWGDLLRIQVVGDVPGRHSRCIGAEDPADDLGFLLDNLRGCQALPSSAGSHRPGRQGSGRHGSRRSCRGGPCWRDRPGKATPACRECRSGPGRPAHHVRPRWRTVEGEALVDASQVFLVAR